MIVRIVAFSRRGCELANKIKEVLTDHDCSVYSKTASDAAGTERIDGPVSAWTKESFVSADAIIFVGAAGIAVRYVAPFLKSKTVDPAIVCVDERGLFAIPLVSGHIGGANDLARFVAHCLGATPVITTATDIHDRFSVDSYAVKNNLHIGSMSFAKAISSQIVDDKKVGLVSDVPISKNVPSELDLNGNEEYGIYISYGTSDGPFKKTLKLTPMCHILGIGCRRGVSKERIETFVKDVLKKENISMNSIRSVASIDLKSDEKGLLEFSEDIKVTPKFFSSDALSLLPDIGFTPSERVKRVTGVDNVCERAAVAASINGELVIKKISGEGVTLAVAREPVFLDLTRR
jgi:cobalt-precorrin 5A hydrolase